MTYFLLKTEPSDYSLSDLERDGETVWDGVENAQAIGFLRQIRKGDACFIYHTATEKQITGLATATGDAFPPPDTPKLAVIPLRFTKRYTLPLTLATMKTENAFAGFELLRLPRLSVMPVPESIALEILRRVS